MWRDGLVTWPTTMEKVHRAWKLVKSSSTHRWVCWRGGGDKFRKLGGPKRYLKVEEEQVIIHREGKFKQGEAGDEEADLRPSVRPSVRVDGWWEERKEVEAREV